LSCRRRRPGRDILVEVKAASVNLVDVKIRQTPNLDLEIEGDRCRCVVIAVGPDAASNLATRYFALVRSADPAPTLNITLLTSARRREAEDARLAAAAALRDVTTAWETLFEP